jgi:hypothetical protein
VEKRVIVVLLLLGCGGLPTDPVPGNCAKDEQCPAGWKCGKDKNDQETFYRCFCAGPSCPDAGLAVDGPIADGTDGGPRCSKSGDCPAGRPVCGPTGTCVECLEATACKEPGKPFCVANACVGCQAAGAGACKAPTATCDATSGRCVECTGDNQCTADPYRPFCVANVCSGCGNKEPAACTARNAGKPVCGPGGDCVECSEAAHCKDPSKAFCVGSICVGCRAVNAAACRPPTGACDAASGKCVECTADTHCIHDGNRPFCVAQACVGCGKAAAQACAAKDSMKPACSPAGPCVECNTSGDCGTPGKPICNAGKCEPCSSDVQCAAKAANPGICMSHQDGRCATDAETIYVQNGAGCSAGPGAGSVAMPFCKPQDALAVATSTRRVVAIRGPAAVAGFAWSNASVGQLSVIGQAAATIAGGADPGIRLTAGDLYARDLTVAPSANVGVVAELGSTLRLSHVVVRDNAQGGILVNGAAFDISNTRVTANGPGDIMGFPWGGVRIQAVLASPARLERVTINDNKQVGLSCSANVSGMGVLASGNAGGVDIATTCAISACSPAGPTCGAE